MESRSQIENTLYRYAWMYDMDELPGIGLCFTADATVEFSTGAQVGRAAVEAELVRRRDAYRPSASRPWHVITNVFVRRETAHEAEVASFYTFLVKPTEGRPVLQGIGYYDDLFVEDGDAWRVRARRVVAL